MNGLPRKYAKMGFKAGWKAYKSHSRGITTMAKRKRSRRGGFKKARSRGGSRGMMSGWIPLSGREMLVDFGVGLTVLQANKIVSPYLDGLLEMTGDYRGEARTAIIGMVAYKFGSGLIKEAGKEYFRFAVMSSGVQTAPRIFNDTITSLVPDQY